MNIIKKYGLYREWKKIKGGAEPINMKRGAGYYITVGLIGHNPKGKIEEIKMKSGKVAIAKLISYKRFRDPDDMIEESYWHITGYKGEKKIKEMTFKEFIKLYS